MNGWQQSVKQRRDNVPDYSRDRAAYIDLCVRQWLTTSITNRSIEIMGAEQVMQIAREDTCPKMWAERNK
jgi:hypothetical protein